VHLEKNDNFSLAPDPSLQTDIKQMIQKSNETFVRWWRSNSWFRQHSDKKV